MMRKMLLLVALAAIVCQAERSDDQIGAISLYSKVILGNYEGATNDTLSLATSGKKNVICIAVNKLIKENQPNFTSYAYNVYLKNAEIIEYFPGEFKTIFEGNNVTITTNKTDGFAIKGGLAVDGDGNRITYGNKEYNTSERFSWQFKPIVKNETVYFKIMNVQRNEYLYSAPWADIFGDRVVYSSPKSDTDSHLWYLKPFNNTDLLFYIYNKAFKQAMKLSKYEDEDGDRLVYIHNGEVSGSPGLFTWFIQSF